MNVRTALPVLVVPHEMSATLRMNRGTSSCTRLTHGFLSKGNTGLRYPKEKRQTTLGSGFQSLPVRYLVRTRYWYVLSSRRPPPVRSSQRLLTKRRHLHFRCRIQDKLERVDSSQWRALLYSLCFMHSVVQVSDWSGLNRRNGICCYLCRVLRTTKGRQKNPDKENITRVEGLARSVTVL